MSKMFFLSKSAMAATALALALAVLSTTSVLAAPATASKTASNNAEQIWGNQFRELQTDRVIFDKIKSHPSEFGKSSKPSKFQHLLDQYAFALSQAEAIMLHGSPSSTADVKVNNRFEKSLTSQQELATYLHMIRGIQLKFSSL